MNLRDYFSNIDLNELKNFVKEKVSESLFLEFKTANYPNGIEFDKKNFSKCLSGFSNSSGGILVWGVSAKEQKGKPDVADELKPISDLMSFESYLKKNEGNAVIPLLENVEYKRVFEEEENDVGYLVLYIPSSERAPHMGLFADKRYYKRSGDSFYQCEHFDIVDMLNRRHSPKLTIELDDEELILIRKNENRYRYRSMLKLKNIGEVSAHHIEISIHINHPFMTWRFGVDGNNNTIFKKIELPQKSLRYFGGSNLVLHPETFIEIDKVCLNDMSDNYDLQDLRIEFSIVADNMKKVTGVILKSKDEINQNTSTL